MQVTYTLSLAEEFRETFASAFSLMFVIGGTVSLFLGGITGNISVY